MKKLTVLILFISAPALGLSEKCKDDQGKLIMTDQCIYEYMDTNWDSLPLSERFQACSTEEVDYTGFNQSEKCKQFRAKLEVYK